MFEHEVYTIGHTESYEQALEEAKKTGEPVFKKGRDNSTDGYPGGHAFKTESAARAYIKTGLIEEDFREEGQEVSKEDFSVLILKADWDKDTYRGESPYYNNLIRDCRILRKSFSPINFDTNAKPNDVHEMFSMCSEGCLSYVEELVEKGIDPNSRDGYALELAASGGHLEIVKYLVEKGLNIDKNKPVKLALFAGHLHVVDYLLDQGADLGVLNIFDMPEESVKYLYKRGYVSDEELDEYLKIWDFIRTRESRSDDGLG